MYRKFKNKKVKIEGLTFDSKKEFKRWKDLVDRQKNGEIKYLDRQVKFEILPKQVGERAITYIADFVYLDHQTSYLVIEDVKSKVTKKQPEYIMKRKLVKYFYCGGNKDFEKIKTRFPNIPFKYVMFNEYE